MDVVSKKLDGTAQTDSTGEPVVLVSVADQGVLVPTDMDNSLNRDHTSIAATREKVTWDVSDNVRQVTITVRNAANPALATEFPGAHWLAVTFNADSDGTANTWLQQVNSETLPSKVYLITIGAPRTFTFSAALTRLDLKRAIGTMTLNAIIEAKAGS